ncbi:MAG: hypothetical protein HYR89_10630 [Actinobacteria bacterium]|nr:hypothetical protein [Actinomycetota bacterium]MBI3256224.1 hypothetical protein [Actinomycetota bacterium]
MSGQVMSGRGGSRVICYVPNLMDRSRISAGVPGAAFVASPEDLVERVAETQRDHPSDRVLVVVDLDRPGVIEAIEGLTGHGPGVIGFGSHVARDTLSAATAAGCRAFPRSELFRRLSEGIENLALSDGREPRRFR